MHYQPQAVFSHQHGSFRRCACETAWSLLALVVGWEEVTRLLPSYLMLEENSSRMLNEVVLLESELYPWHALTTSF